MIANHSFFDWSAVLKDHAGIVTATDRTNLSNELARTVERVAAGCRQLGMWKVGEAFAVRSGLPSGLLNFATLGSPPALQPRRAAKLSKPLSVTSLSKIPFPLLLQ